MVYIEEKKNYKRTLYFRYKDISCFIGINNKTNISEIDIKSTLSYICVDNSLEVHDILCKMVKELNTLNLTLTDNISIALCKRKNKLLSIATIGEIELCASEEVKILKSDNEIEYIVLNSIDDTIEKDITYYLSSISLILNKGYVILGTPEIFKEQYFNRLENDLSLDTIKEISLETTNAIGVVKFK